MSYGGLTLELKVVRPLILHRLTPQISTPTNFNSSLKLCVTTILIVIPPLEIVKELIKLVPMAGLEPARFWRGILSALCLPFHHIGVLKNCHLLLYYLITSS